MNRLIRRIFITTLIPLCIPDLPAQTSISASYPEVKHTYLTNPTQALGRLDESEKIAINVVYQNYLNLLREIRLADFSAFGKIGRIHQAGLLASSFREGEFISKSSLAFQYAVRIKVMRQSIVSASATGGFKNLTIDGTLTGIAKTSSLVPDLSLHGVLQNPHYYFLIGSNQLIGNKMKPGIQVLRLKRFYESRLGIRIPLVPKLRLISQVHAQLFEKRKTSIGGIIGLEVLSLIRLAIGTYDGSTLLFQTGLLLPAYKNWEMTFLGSYRQLVGGPGSLLHNSMEISVGMSKKKKEDVYVPTE